MAHNGSNIHCPSMAVAYQSGFGHTAVLADAVARVRARTAHR